MLLHIGCKDTTFCGDGQEGIAEICRRECYLEDDGSEYDIVVRLEEEDRNSISDIMDLSIPTAMGKTVKLSEVAEVGEYWAPPTIERKARQRIGDYQGYAI